MGAIRLVDLTLDGLALVLMDELHASRVWGLELVVYGSGVQGGETYCEVSVLW